MSRKASHPNLLNVVPQDAPPKAPSTCLGIVGFTSSGGFADRRVFGVFLKDCFREGSFVFVFL